MKDNGIYVGGKKVRNLTDEEKKILALIPDILKRYLDKKIGGRKMEKTGTKTTLKDLMNMYLNCSHDVLPPVVKCDGLLYVFNEEHDSYIYGLNDAYLFERIDSKGLEKEIIVYQEGRLYDLVPDYEGDDWWIYGLEAIDVTEKERRKEEVIGCVKTYEMPED